jgi:hypothetical protein
MSARSLLLTVSTCLVALPGALAAQGSPPRISARVGVLAPDPYLYEYFANFSGDGPLEWTTGTLGRTLVLGLAVEKDFKDGALTLRGEMTGAFAGWTSVAHSIVVARDLFEPPYVQTTWLDVPSSLTTVSVQALLPMRLEVGPLRPYVLAGLGGKYYDFGDPTPANTVNATLPENGFTWGGDVGAGFTVPFLGITWDIQGRDAMNRYWGKTQHDFLFTSGVLFPLG